MFLFLYSCKRFTNQLAFLITHLYTPSPHNLHNLPNLSLQMTFGFFLSFSTKFMTFIISLILMFSANVSHIKNTFPPNKRISKKKKGKSVQYGIFNHPALALFTAIEVTLTSPHLESWKTKTYLIIMFIFIRHETYFQHFLF